MAGRGSPGLGRNPVGEPVPHLRVLGVAGGSQERCVRVGSKGGCGALVLRAKALPHTHLPGTRAAAQPRRIVRQGLGRRGAAAPLQPHSNQGMLS